MKARLAVLAGSLGFMLVLSSCGGADARASLAAGEGGVAALTGAGAIERLADRSAPRVPAGATAPNFVVDPGWPKPLPNDWRISQVGGITVDTHDNIWVYHRPRALESSSAGALPRAGTNARGIPVSGLGHPRPYADRNTGCCVPAPSGLDRTTGLVSS